MLSGNEGAVLLLLILLLLAGSQVSLQPPSIQELGAGPHESPRPVIRTIITLQFTPCDQDHDHAVVIIPHQNQDHNTVLTL